MASVAASVPRRLSICAPYDSSKPHHPPTLTMVLEAVQVLDNPKGVSAFAIKRYILCEYPGVDPVRLKYYLKQALVKGVNQGYLVRPPKSSARGASGSFKLGKEKAQQRKSLKKKFPGDKTAAQPEMEMDAVKQPKAKAPKPKLKPKEPQKSLAGHMSLVGAELVKKVSSTKPKAALGDGGATVSGEKPKAKASGKKAAKPTKGQSVPKAPQAKPASGPKKGLPKTKAELKGVPEAKVKSKLPPDGKAKGNAVPKGAVAKSRAASETKAGHTKGKPKAKKGAARGQGKEKSTAGSEA